MYDEETTSQHAYDIAFDRHFLWNGRYLIVNLDQLVKTIKRDEEKEDAFVSGCIDDRETPDEGELDRRLCQDRPKRFVGTAWQHRLYRLRGGVTPQAERITSKNRKAKARNAVHKRPWHRLRRRETASRDQYLDDLHESVLNETVRARRHEERHERARDLEEMVHAIEDIEIWQSDDPCDLERERKYTAFIIDGLWDYAERYKVLPRDLGRTLMSEELMLRTWDIADDLAERRRGYARSA